MPSDSISSLATERELLEPAYWLVAGLEWREGAALAEAALAVAPSLIPRAALSHHAYQVLGCADLYATRHGTRVVLLSDLTRMFTGNGASLSEVSVDWHAALSELEDGPHPALFLTINERAYLVICDPTADHDETDPANGHEWLNYERELVRNSITAKLDADWADYMHHMISSGRIRTAG